MRREFSILMRNGVYVDETTLTTNYLGSTDFPTLHWPNEKKDAIYWKFLDGQTIMGHTDEEIENVKENLELCEIVNVQIVSVA